MLRRIRISFLSLKATDILAWRESPGQLSAMIASLNVTNNHRETIVAHFE